MRAQTQDPAHHLAHQGSCTERIETFRAPYRTRSILGYRSGLRVLPPNRNSRLWMRQNQNPYDVVRLERRFRSSNRGTGGIAWEVHRAHRARRVEHRPVDWRMVNPWDHDQDQDWNWAPLPESKSKKHQQSQLQTSTTYHSTGSYVPSVRPGPPLASTNDPTTPADFGPPPPPTLAQPVYHKAQTKKVLKHTRAELMKEARKAGYNGLVVEG